MPIEIRSAEDAYAGLNKMSRYPSPDRDGDRYKPHPDVQHLPKFSITRDHKILTIGSCFARNIERALRELDMNVISSYVPGMIGDDNISNKYTSRSILSDLRLALGDAPPTDAELGRTIYTDEKGLARNLAFGGAGTAKGDTLESVLESSRRFYANLSRLREADVVIITFGLIENWYDAKNDVYLNIRPSVAEVRKAPGRFQLHVLSFDDLRIDMTEIFRLIRERGKVGVQVLATISPVPLKNTFRGQDCLQANAYSKAAQRAALEEVSMQFENVHYFPSYEMVTLAAPSVAWVKDDFRHVRPETVDRIMRKVISAYVAGEALPPEKAELMLAMAAKDFQLIIDRVEAYVTASSKDIEACPVFMQYYFGAACVRVGRIKEGLGMLRRVVAVKPNHPNAQKLIAHFGG